MKIKYYTNIAKKLDAEALHSKTQLALTQSKLPFKCDILRERGSYFITVTLSLDVFDSWAEMESYVRKLIVCQNINAHRSV